MFNVRLATKQMEMGCRALEMVAYYKYVYGMKHSYGRLTQDRINILAKDNPSTFSSSYVAKANKLIGKLCIDCSGLVCYLWQIQDIGSWDISQLPKTKPNRYAKVKLTELKWGDCVWKKGHVGIYLGDGRVIEAKGIDYGVRISNLGDTPWVYGIRDKELHFYGRLGWCKTDGKWWFTYGESKGEYLHDTTVQIDGKQYTFDADGWLIE